MKNLFLIVIFVLLQTNLFSQTDKEDYNKGVELFKKANIHKSKYELDQAINDFNTAGELFKKHAYTGNYLQCASSEAELLIRKNKFSKAKNVLDEASKIAVEKYGKKNKYLIRILYAEGLLDFYKGDVDNSIIKFKKSLNLNAEIVKKDNLFTASVLSALGNAYSLQGNYKLAKENYLKDLGIRKAKFGENHPSLAVAYNNLSIVERNLGNFDEALKYIDKALNISKAVYGEVNPETANYYSGKGSVYYDKGQNELANSFFNKALGIKLKVHGEMHKSVADEYNNIGIIYKENGDLDKAIAMFKDAYEIQKVVLGEDHPDIAMTCNNIGYILERQQKSQSSLAYYKEAIKIKSKYSGSNHPDLAVYYNNISINYNKLHKLDEALQYSLKAIDILKRNYGNKHSGLVRILINTGDIYLQKKDYNTALKYYQQSIVANVRTFNPDSTDYISNPVLRKYSDINKLLISLKGKTQALDAIYITDSLKTYAEASYNTYVLCDSVINIAKRTTIKESDKIILGNKAKIIYENAVTSAMGMSYLQEKEKYKLQYIKKAFYFSEKNKASVLSESISMSEAKKFAGLPDDIIKEEKNLNIKIANLETKIAETTDPNILKIYQNQLFDFNENFRKLSNKIEKAYPDYFKFKYKNTYATLSEIQKSLDKETVILSYFVGENDVLAFTITRKNIFVSPKSVSDEFDEKVKRYLTVLTSGLKSQFKESAKLAYELQEILIPKNIPEETKEIIIIPDGILGLIPYESLFTKEYTGDIMKFSEYPFLLKKYMASYYYSADLYYKATKKEYTSKSEAYLGIAPVFKNLADRNINGFNIEEIPATEKEVKEIAKIFKNKKISSTSVLNKKATEEFIKTTDLKKYKYIHIATHGIVNTEHPELSGIVLYPNHKKNEGLLFSGEIYNLELNADLVVLSACETGIGKISKSEGIIGLPRALLYAGANNVVVSLWKVSDASTSELMIDLYKNIIDEEMTYTEALYHAKLKMANKTKGFYAHPYFWSPFILIGK